MTDPAAPSRTERGIGRRERLGSLPPWMTEPATRTLFAALAAAGIDARFVGGSVRDALLGRPTSDLDIATPAHPEQVLAALAAAGLKAVATGLAHGTVTAVVPPRHFEITTLRRDVATDGRHAVVAFDADWAADAARRDFTINALYLSLDGTIDDPVGGLADLRASRVRFVGDPARRIAEDVLRLLRYYRFEARFGTGEGDLAARAACRAAIGGLPTLSAERVAQEFLKLLAAPDPGPALAMMDEDRVLAALLPEATRLDRLRRLVALEVETGEACDPIRRLAALVLVARDGAVALAERLRLSNTQRDRLEGLTFPPSIPIASENDQRVALYRLRAERYRDLGLLRAADHQMTLDQLRELLNLARSWTPPVFPLTGRDVVATGVSPGPRVGRLLADVRNWWEAADFAPDRAACLAFLADAAGREESVIESMLQHRGDLLPPVGAGSAVSRGRAESGPEPQPAQTGKSSPGRSPQRNGQGGAARVAAALAAAGLHDRLKGFAETTRTAAEAAAAIGCPVAAIAKSIVLRAKDGRAVVVVASGAARVDEAKVAAAVGVAVGRADAAFVRDTTGFAIGGVSPLGLPGTVVLLIDQALFAMDEIWAAAGTPFTVFRTTADEVERLTGARRADVAVGSLPR